PCRPASTASTTTSASEARSAWRTSSKGSRRPGSRSSVEHELVLELFEEVLAPVAAVGPLEELGRSESRPYLPVEARRPLAAHLVRRARRDVEAFAGLVDPRLARDDRSHPSLDHCEVLVLGRMVMRRRQIAGAGVRRLHLEQIGLDRDHPELDSGGFQ